MSTKQQNLGRRKMYLIPLMASAAVSSKVLLLLIHCCFQYLWGLCAGCLFCYAVLSALSSYLPPKAGYRFAVVRPPEFHFRKTKNRFYPTIHHSVMSYEV